jgi:hypothetical protein
MKRKTKRAMVMLMAFALLGTSVPVRATASGTALLKATQNEAAVAADDTTSIQQIEIQHGNEITIETGDTVQLIGAVCEDSNWETTEENWSSSDTAVAALSYEGNAATVTGVAAGQVTIQHLYKTYPKYSDMNESPKWYMESVTLTVKEKKAENHFLLDGTKSSNIVLYATTGNGENGLQEVLPGKEFVTEDTDVYFFVYVPVGYGTDSTFSHTVACGDENRKEYVGWSEEKKESKYLAIDDTSYNPPGLEEAIQKECSYKFQYTGMTGSRSYFWAMLGITASPIEVRVVYNANGGTNAPVDSNVYYHKNVSWNGTDLFTLSSQEPTWEGKKFVGWKDAQGNVYKKGTELEINKIWSLIAKDGTYGTFTLTAEWEDDTPASGDSDNGTPDNPSEGTPDNPSEGTPDTPSEGTPDNPSEGTPDTPSEETPDTPSEETPDTPSEETPDNPSEGTPSTPTNGTPNTPSNGTPNTPSNGTPNTPSNGTPNTPTNGTPNTPTNGTPDTPSDETVNDSTGNTDDNPNGESANTSTPDNADNTADKTDNSRDKGSGNREKNDSANTTTNGNSDRNDNGTTGGTANNVNQTTNNTTGGTADNTAGNTNGGTAGNTANNTNGGNADNGTAGNTAGNTNGEVDVTNDEITDEDTTIIEEEDTPRGASEDDGNSDSEVVSIEDEQTPLAGGATWALINLIAAIFTAVFCIILLLTSKKKKEEDTYDEETEKNKRRRKFVLGSIVTAVAGIIIFCVTENMHNQMALVDRWTALMLILLALELILVFFAAKNEDDDKNYGRNSKAVQ